MGKEEIEKELGVNVSDEQYEKCVGRAKRKLQSIIQRYGDSGGVRRTPDYLAELIIEAFVQELFLEYSIDVIRILMDENHPPIVAL